MHLTFHFLLEICRKTLLPRNTVFLMMQWSRKMQVPKQSLTILSLGENKDSCSHIRNLTTSSCSNVRRAFSKDWFSSRTSTVSFCEMRNEICVSNRMSKWPPNCMQIRYVTYLRYRHSVKPSKMITWITNSTSSSIKMTDEYYIPEV